MDKITTQQKAFLDTWVKGSWVFNESTGLVDVNGHIAMHSYSIKYENFGGIEFGTVTGAFNCSANNLTSLKGSPISAGGFYCQNNKLTSLKDATKDVDEGFDCSNNLLTSLVGAPKKIDSVFDCQNNKLTSLEGGPEKVYWEFRCNGNNLTSLKGLPEVGGGIYCDAKLMGKTGGRIEVKEEASKIAPPKVNRRYYVALLIKEILSIDG